MKIASPNAPLRHPRAELPSHRPGDPFFRAILWRCLGQWVCRYSFHNWYPLRCRVLRLCGARLHTSVKIRASARIDRPWNLQMGKLSAVGDHAKLMCRSRINVGPYCTISQYNNFSRPPIPSPSLLSSYEGSKLRLEDFCDSESADCCSWDCCRPCC